jgi:hypothetical protein
MGEKSEYNGVLKWKLDAERCYRYWYTVGTDCALCMSTCPWTNTGTWVHRILSRLAMIKGPHQRLLATGYRFFFGSPGARDRGRRVGLSSLKPTRLRAHVAAMGVTLAALAVAAVWWRATAGAGTIPPVAQSSGAFSDEALMAVPVSWAVYLIWLAWTLLGLAVAWTFASERELRAALLALALFGVPSVLLALFAIL